MPVANSKWKECWDAPCMGSGGNATLPLNHEIIAPWVRVKFTSANPPMEITVGNETSKAGGGAPFDNLCVIKSFQYGFASGVTNGSFEVNIEIIDAQGGQFDVFVTRVFPKNLDKEAIPTNFSMEFQFGWTFRDCGLSLKTNALATGNGGDAYKSQPMYASPMLVDTKYDSNQVKFMVKGTSPVDQLLNTGSQRIVYGNKYENVRLKTAIWHLFSQYGIKVLFLRRTSSGGFGPEVKKRLAGVNPLDPDKFINPLSEDQIFSIEHGDIKEFERSIFGNLNAGGAVEWSFPEDHGGFEGPKYMWATNNRDPVEAALAWIAESRTDENRGVVVGVANNLKNQPIIIFWETPLPDCDGKFPFQQQPIGYYLINAGKCSPVIEFKPSIKWNAAVKNKGGNSSSMSGKPVEAGNQCNLSGEGTADASQVSDFQERAFGGSAAAEAAMSNAAHSRANISGFQAIEADLICQGDPRYYSPLIITGRRVGLVVVNPFTLMPSPNSSGAFDCGGFGQIANSSINHFFSHSGWMIKGIDHQIKEGSFTTCYKLLMAVPGVTIDRDAPIGAEPCTVVLPPPGNP